MAASPERWRGKQVRSVSARLGRRELTLCMRAASTRRRRLRSHSVRTEITCRRVGLWRPCSLRRLVGIYACKRGREGQDAIAVADRPVGLLRRSGIAVVVIGRRFLPCRSASGMPLGEVRRIASTLLRSDVERRVSHFSISIVLGQRTEVSAACISADLTVESNFTRRAGIRRMRRDHGSVSSQIGGVAAAATRHVFNMDRSNRSLRSTTQEWSSARAAN